MSGNSDAQRAAQILIENAQQGDRCKRLAEQLFQAAEELEPNMAPRLRANALLSAGVFMAWCSGLSIDQIAECCRLMAEKLAGKD